MAKKKHLFIGFGDIASRCAKVLIAQGDEVVGIARTPRREEEGLSFVFGDAKNTEVLAVIASQKFESAVITLSPNAYAESDYRECYYDTSKALLSLWEESAHPPNKILFISSTSVYPQEHGETVDESSFAEPSSPTASVLRETESLFLECDLHASVIRFSGIYGPGRDYLLRQVQKGNGGTSQFTNRIHVEDCCGVICFLVDQKVLHDMYLASDDCPVTSKDIREWLADALGVDRNALTTPETAGRGGSKRCSNQKLKAMGYRFKYPDYRDGYIQMINGGVDSALSCDKLRRSFVRNTGRQLLVGMSEYSGTDKDDSMDLYAGNIGQHWNADEIKDFEAFVDEKTDALYKIVYRVNGRIAGFLGCREIEDFVWVEWLIIRKEEHGKGIGKLIISELHNIYKNKDLRLSSTPYTQKFYEKCGFVIERIESGGYPDGTDKVRMKYIGGKHLKEG